MKLWCKSLGIILRLGNLAFKDTEDGVAITSPTALEQAPLWYLPIRLNMLERTVSSRCHRIRSQFLECRVSERCNT
jgi:hypothetical protein